MNTYVKPDADVLDVAIDESIMSGTIGSFDEGVEDDW